MLVKLECVHFRKCCSNISFAVYVFVLLLICFLVENI